MVDLDYLPNSNVLGIYHHHTAASPRLLTAYIRPINNTFILGQIELSISPESAYVIIGFLEHRDCQHEYQRSHVGHHEAHFEERNELRECYQQEEHVEEEFEFVVEE